MRIVLAGPGWDDPARAGMHLHNARLGDPRSCRAANRARLPGQRPPSDADGRHQPRRIPYQSHPSFQGSGAIADYLAGGVPVLATAVANMAELIVDAGAVVLPRDPAALADHLGHLTSMNGSAERARAAAGRRAGLFTAEHHARKCAARYARVIAHSRTATRR